MNGYSVAEEKAEREKMLKETEKNDMSVLHMSKEEFEKYIKDRQRKKKSKKTKVKRCKCK